MGTVFCSTCSTITVGGGGPAAAVFPASFLLQPALINTAAIKAAPSRKSWRLGLIFIVNSSASGDVWVGKRLELQVFVFQLQSPLSLWYLIWCLPDTLFGSYQWRILGARLIA